MIDAGLGKMLGSIGWGADHVTPLVIETSAAPEGVLPTGFKAKNCSRVGSGCEAIYQHTKAHCGVGNFPLILGGDHCISIGTISAIKEARKDAAIVWVSIIFSDHIHKIIFN
jgi:arginase